MHILNHDLPLGHPRLVQSTEHQHPDSMHLWPCLQLKLLLLLYPEQSYRGCNKHAEAITCIRGNGTLHESTAGCEQEMSLRAAGCTSCKLLHP